MKMKYVLLSFGVVIAAAGVLLPVPATLNYLSWMESIAVKIIAVAVGIVIAVLGVRYDIVEKRRLVFRRMLYTLVIIAVFMLFIEAVLQLQTVPQTYMTHGIYDHALIPGSAAKLVSAEFNTNVSINSLGLRDREILNKTSFRILMLGDSFTWGFGVDIKDTFSKILEKMGSWEVINGGVTSYSPILEYLYLREDGLKLQPDMIILNFDMSDVFDDRIYEKSAVFNGTELLKVEPSKASTNPLVTVLANVKLVKIVKAVIENVYSGTENKPVVEDATVGNIEYDKYAIMRYNFSDEADWNRTLGYIRKINMLAKERGIRFAIVVYPYGNQVNGKEWNRGRFTFSFKEGVVYSDRAAEILEDFGRSENITVINAFDDFKKSGDYPLFFAYDGHFTEKGHALLANVIYKRLKEMGI